ncbi:MAG: prolipoprotein diacylglyceryl transferase [Candidatus Gracilibacteria bacterium]|nr:prolipoprotein diacylglyceryl transferase [Candidatus Gracilibacteria bacterium]
MYPVLFSIGPVTIYSFGIFAALGFLLSMVIINKLAQKNGLKTAFILDHIIPFILLSLISGRLLHVLLKWELYSHRLREILFFWQGGVSLWGAIIGGALYFWYISWKHKQDVLVWLDQMVFAIQVAFILGYTGYLLSPAGLSGNAFGKPTELPWGMTLANLDSPYAGLSVHPVIFYLILGHLIILFVLRSMHKIRKLAGLRFFVAAALMGTLTVSTEPLKYNPNYMLWGHSVASYVAIGIILISVAGLFYVLRMDRKFRKQTPHSF